MTQLFGDRMLIANATLLVDLQRQPADDALHHDATVRSCVGHSLFEDNAEFAWDALAVDTLDAGQEPGQELSPRSATTSSPSCSAPTRRRAGSLSRRAVAALGKLSARKSAEAGRLLALAEYFVKKNVWIVGVTAGPRHRLGGLDHVRRWTRHHVLVLDTRLLQHRGQASKATPSPRQRSSRPPARIAKKDLG